MPEAAALAVAEFFAFDLAAGAAITSIASTVTYVVGSAVVSAGINAALSSLGGDGSTGAGGTVAPRVTNTTIRQSSAPRRLVFGEVKTGGLLVWPGQTADGRAHLLIAISEGEIESINPIFWLGEELSTEAKFAGLLGLDVNLGGAGKGINAGLLADFATERTAAHVGLGIADVVVRYTFDANAFARGLILPVFLVRGIKCFDPRTGATAWTRNPALVALYIERSEFGYRSLDADIDFDSYVAAANICDEVITSVDPLNIVNGVPGRVLRYTLDAVFETSVSPAVIMQSIVEACAGARINVGGRVSFFAGAYRAPTGPVITGEYLRGPATVRTHAARQQRINIARGTYREPRQDWQQVDFAQQTDSAAVLAEQGEIVQSFNFQCTTVGATAQRLARIAMRRARASVPLVLPCNWAGIQWQLWDVVTVNLPLLGIVNQVYVIVDYKYAQGGGVDLTLVPDSPDIYVWDPAVHERAVPQILLPQFGQEPASISGLVMSGAPAFVGLVALPTLSATWDASSSAFFREYQVQWRLTTEPNYTNSAAVTTPSWSSQVGEVGAYDFRVRQVFTDDAVGEWAEMLNTLVLGDTVPPGVPTLLSVSGSGTGIHTIGWTNPADGDFAKANVWRNSVNNSATSVIGAIVPGLPSAIDSTTLGAAVLRYYWVSAEDNSGNNSSLIYAGTAT